MRRRPSPLRASLLLAVVVTALAVLLGTVVTPKDSAAPEQAVAELSGAAAGSRPGDASRSAVRPTVGADESVTPDASTAPPSTAGSPSPSGSAAATEVVPGTGQAGQALPAFKVKQAPTLRRLPPGPVPGDPFTFQIGTLNILGSQHRGNGTGRAAALASAIVGRGVDIVGLQEVQDDQLAVMNARLAGYSIWPGQSLGNQGVRLQIAFRDSLFELVDTGSIITTFDFQQRPIPWVLLRERATGGEFYVIDIHNSPGGQSAARYSATTEEIALVNSLRATGKPVFLMGDTNEHTTTACRIAGATGMVGSNGLSNNGGCSAGAGPIKIDWILGAGGVDFSGHVVDYGAPVAASTDHAFVHASVTVTPLIPQEDAAGN